MSINIHFKIISYDITLFLDNHKQVNYRNAHLFVTLGFLNLLVNPLLFWVSFFFIYMLAYVNELC